MKPLTVAIDVDEVCADLLGEWLRRYNVDYADNLLPENLTQWDLTQEVKAECGARIFTYLRGPDLYDHVLPIPGARKAVYEILAMGHRVIYVTACPGDTAAQKKAWLVRWGFLTPANADKDFVPVSDKSLINADVLFDDRPENCVAFSNLGVLIRQPHNLFARQSFKGYILDSLVDAPSFIRRELK